MPEEVVQAANGIAVWFIAVIVVSVVALQAALYIRLAFRTAGKIHFPREKCTLGLRSGLISAIGPSIAIFIVMVGMMSVVGGPMTWLRLSIIGAAPTELTAATLGSEAYGAKFGGPDYDMMALATSWWAMSVNGVGWLLVVGLFAHRLEYIREKAGGGDPKWLALLGGAAMLGAFACLNARSIAAGSASIAAAVAGALVMVGLLLARRLTWLKEYALGFAMLAGMAVAMLVRHWGTPS